MARSFLFVVLKGLLLFIVISCSDSEFVSNSEKVITEVNINLDSAAFQKVYDHRDRWEIDSLLPFFHHKDPSFRAFSARIISDIGDGSIAKQLGSLLSDTIPEVRRAALYSLGQLRSPESVPYLMEVFSQQDTMGVDPLAFKYALEGIGKCGDSSYLSALATISTYTYKDTLLLQGQALGILNMAYRGFSHPKATSLMVQFVSDSVYSYNVKLFAAQYLATVKDVSLSEFSQELFDAIENERNPNIRMFLAESLGKTAGDGYAWMSRNFSREEDFRVRIQMLRGALNFSKNRTHALLAKGVRDSNLEVAREAADLIIEHGSSAYSQTYLDWAFANFRKEIKYKIFAIANRYITNNRFRNMNQQLVYQQYNRTTDPYLKSDLIRACGYNPSTLSRLLQWYDEDENLAVRTSIIESVIQITKESSGNLTTAAKDFLVDRWLEADAAAVSLISAFIGENAELFPELKKRDEKWNLVQQKISMPGGVEAMISLKKAKAAVLGENFDSDFYKVKENYTHPIDWTLYKSLSTSSRAEVNTEKGSFEIQLYTEHAPATVVNFVELAEAGYFNKKPFHRVVPNFVVQGGGNRGDGYGSLDYTIRSELGPEYFDDEGYVGMASAGKHTESQQWFVTHRPTLHLNGKYTIFGKVINNMEVVRQLERGDVIQEINIKY